MTGQRHRRGAARMLRERRFEFPLERAVFMTVLHRLFVSGSDRAAERWMRDQALAGTEECSSTATRK